MEGRACQITKVTTGLIFGNQAFPKREALVMVIFFQADAGAGVTGSASTGMKPLLGSEQDAMISHPPINTRLFREPFNSGQTAEWRNRLRRYRCELTRQ